MATKKPVKKNNDDFGEFRNIYINDIIENDENPRTEISSVEDLKASIKAQGLMQPIVVRRIDNGFKVVAGSRRFKACKELKMGAVPCIVIDADDATAYELATAENIVRENMTAVDEANAVAKLFAQGKSRTEIGAMFGKSARWAEGRRRIVELGDKAMEYLAAGKINLGHAEVLAMCRKEDVERFLSVATWKTPEDLKNYIMNEKPLLERAPFNAKKVCKNCENRSDCQRDLFGDVQNSYCLNRECFESKVKKEAERIRRKYIAEGYEEVPENKRYEAMHGWSGWYDDDTEDENERDFINAIRAEGEKPMFWVDDDSAESGLVWCNRGLAFADDEDDEELDLEKDDGSWNFQIRHMSYERKTAIKNEASAREKYILHTKFKELFGFMHRNIKAMILELMDCAHETEDENGFTKCESYLKHISEADDDFIEKIIEEAVSDYDGVDNDIREFFGMESRETFEREATEAIPEDETGENDDDDE